MTCAVGQAATHAAVILYGSFMLLLHLKLPFSLRPQSVTYASTSPAVSLSS